MGSRYVLLMVGIFLTIQIVSTKADGKLTYGEQCSVQSAILQLFSNTEREDQKCNSNQGLICTGSCSCPPTRVWQRGFFFGLFGGGGCIVGANGPCTKDDQCVDNAVCGDTIPLCYCKDGYHAHELQCISSYYSSGSTSVKMVWPTFSMLFIIVANVFLIR